MSMKITPADREMHYPEDRQSLAAYLLQGAGFLAFLVGMMVLAGWRG
jgi:hypothetical protein